MNVLNFRMNQASYMRKIITLFAFATCSHALSAQNKDGKTLSLFADDFFLLRIDNTSILYGGIGLVVLAVVGYLVYRFFKSTAEKKSDFIPVIKRVVPNPSHGPVTIEIQGKASQLKVFNLNRQPLGAFAITGGDLHFDLSKMPRGHYIVIAYYGATQSNAVQFTLQ